MRLQFENCSIELFHWICLQQIYSLFDTDLILIVQQLLNARTQNHTVNKETENSIQLSIFTILSVIPITDSFMKMQQTSSFKHNTKRK